MKKRKEIDDEKKSIPFHMCCSKNCHFNTDTKDKPKTSHNDIILYLKRHHKIVSGWTHTELKDTIQREVNQAVNRDERILTTRNRGNLTFTIIVANSTLSLCEECYLHLYRTTKNGYPSARSFSRMKAAAKASKLGDDLSKHIKHTKTKKNTYFENINEALKFYKKHKHLTLEGLTMDHFAYACLPQTARYLQAYYWMKAFFELECESPPNNGNISELTAALYDKKIVYDLYEKEILLDHPSDEHLPLSYSEFLDLWLTVYPNVKVKEYKSVSGKCGACAAIFELQKLCTGYEDFQRLEHFKLLHRIEVTTQKAAYYSSRRLAEVEPEKYMSVIVDGMQQSHSELPYFGNQKEYPYKVVQYLTGCKQHGFASTFHRSFPHIKHGVNLTITCLMHQILMRQNHCMESNSKMPTHLLIQIDGGPENTAKPFLAFCELLLRLRVFDKIEVNRLPVGHTHEDIDALFGTLWKHLRSEVIKTPQDFKKYVLEAFNIKE
jgi:hypothetical protein